MSISYRQVIYQSCISLDHVGMMRTVLRLVSNELGVSSHISVASKMLKKLYLSQGSLGKDFLAENIRNLFDCDPFAGLVVRGSTMKNR